MAAPYIETGGALKFNNVLEVSILVPHMILFTDVFRGMCLVRPLRCWKESGSLVRSRLRYFKIYVGATVVILVSPVVTSLLLYIERELKWSKLKTFISL